MTREERDALPDEGARRERGAIVDWLRSRCCEDPDCDWDRLGHTIADCIEAGEHHNRPKGCDLAG
ncbi:MAG: hypothetical protein KC621_32490 [Myxococcales bacterium]|nr:hypothetical protein [Myxococcales bacterium]